MNNYRNYRIRFYLDRVGIYLNLNELLHLDSMIEDAYCAQGTGLGQLEQDDIPGDFPLPFKRSKINNIGTVFHASCLFPPNFQEDQDFQGEDIVETLHYWRKKARLKNIEIVKGSINEMQGPYRSYNTPIPVLLIPYLEGYFCGVEEEVLTLAKTLKGLGKKRGYGLGKVVGVETEEIDEDWSLIKK